MHIICKAYHLHAHHMRGIFRDGQGCFQNMQGVLLCNALHHPATPCNTLQHTATHCNTLQHNTTHCYQFTERVALHTLCTHTLLNLKVGRTGLFCRSLSMDTGLFCRSDTHTSTPGAVAMTLIKDGKDAQDASSCRSLSAKEPLIIRLFCGK